MITIRPVTEMDAAALLDLQTALDQETQFMMLEPDERQTTVEEQMLRILELEAAGNSVTLVAEAEGALAGYLTAYGGSCRRVRHRVSIAVGVRQAYAGQGVGTRLFQVLEAWAPGAGISRLELTVMTHNAAGLALYRKMGFQVEGIRRHSMMVDGAFVDEYYMAKLLNE